MRNEGASWLLQNVKFVRRGGIYPARGTLRRRKPGGYGIRPYDRRRCPRLAGKRGPCIIAKVCRGRCSHRPGNPAPPRNTPCRGRFHIGPACPAADPRRRAVALPCKPGQTLRSPGLPGTQNLPVGAGFIPPAEPHAAANTPGRCEHRPLHGFAMATGVAFPGWPGWPHLWPRVRRIGTFAPAAPVNGGKTGNIPAATQTPQGGRGDPVSARPALPRTACREGRAPPLQTGAHVVAARFA